MKHIAIATASFLFITLAASGQQRTFISARSGNDANVCSLLSPCRNLQRGVDTVAAGGEVVPLDSGGYGMVVINKAVTIASPPGIYVGITSTAAIMQYAVRVATPANVTLRGLSVTNLGGWGGIYDNGGGTLRVESCTVDGGQLSGIVLTSLFTYGNPGGALIVTDTVVTRNALDGIGVSGTDATHHALASIKRVRSSGNGHMGIVADGYGDVAVEDSVVTDNGFAGLSVRSTNTTEVSRMAVDDCVISGNPQGVIAQGAATNPDGAVMRISRSAITHNTAGIVTVNGRIYTRDDNTVVDNGGYEVFADSFAKK